MTKIKFFVILLFVVSFFSLWAQNSKVSLPFYVLKNRQSYGSIKFSADVVVNTFITEEQCKMILKDVVNNERKYINYFLDIYVGDNSQLLGVLIQRDGVVEINCSILDESYENQIKMQFSDVDYLYKDLLFGVIYAIKQYDQDLCLVSFFKDKSVLKQKLHKEKDKYFIIGSPHRDYIIFTKYEISFYDGEGLISTYFSIK